MNNTENHYGSISRYLHWLMAGLILLLFILGIYMVDLNYYDDWYQRAPQLHKSIGIMLATVWLFRISWRFFQIKPTSLLTSRTFSRLVGLTHSFMLLLSAVILISGYLIASADGRAIPVFNLFEMPAILLNIENQEDISGEIHFYSAVTLIIIAGLHSLAALKHHFIDKDKTLSRMLGSFKSN